MTAQEKAKELLEKIYSILLNDFHFYISEEKTSQKTKELCITFVNQLIEQERKYNNGSFYPSNYWKEVKEEIEKL